MTTTQATSNGIKSKVTCDLAMSLDGYVAGPNQSTHDPSVADAQDHYPHVVVD